MKRHINSSARLRAVQTSDLDMILDWRNHIQVSRHMHTKRKISSQEHLSWYQNSNLKQNKDFFIFEIDRDPLGFVNFEYGNNDSVASWGFYIKPNSEKGTGRLLGLTSINYAFSNLPINGIKGEVIDSNFISRNFHLSLGFKFLGPSDYYNIEEAKNYCIFTYILSREDWIEYNINKSEKK